jgi:hypothetical protein
MLQSLVRITVTSTLALHFWMFAQMQLLADRPVSRFATAKEDLIAIAIKLASDSSVPIGVEVASNDENSPLDVSKSESTLGAELDRVVKIDPRYT